MTIDQSRRVTEDFINLCIKLINSESFKTVAKEAFEYNKGYQWGLAIENVLFFMEENELSINQEIFDVGIEAIRSGVIPKENKSILIYLKNIDRITSCNECQSMYFKDQSQMASLCPECTNGLYGYDNCIHSFELGRCTLCYWDGNKSDYLKTKV